MGTRFVTKSSTGPLVFYPPRRFRTPATAATATYRFPAQEDLTGFGLTVDSTSAATTANADRGDDTLTFGSDPGLLPDRDYLLTGTGFEPFIVRFDSTGTTARLTMPLPHDVDSGATIQGYAIEMTLPSAATAETGRGVVFASATIDGATVTWQEPIWIVRSEFGEMLTVEAAVRMAPELMRLRSDLDPALTETVATATESVLHDLEKRGYHRDKINSPDRLNQAIVNRMLWDRYRDIRGPGSETEIAAKADYLQELDGTKESSRWWYDEADEDALTDENLDKDSERNIVLLTR